MSQGERLRRDGEREIRRPDASRSPEADGGQVDGRCGAGCKCGVDRRDFLKIAAAGAASISVASLKPAAGAAAVTSLPAHHPIPIEKGLRREWIRALFEKGRPEVFRGRELDTVGMPIGGIAAGQLYLLGDGRLGCWWIFNRHHFTGYGADCYRRRIPDSPVEQGFAVVVEKGDETMVRKLDRRGFPAVEFVGEYPIGRVRYPDPKFPVYVEMEAFSPFIPLNAKDSTLPATIFNITVENACAEKVRVSLLGWLQNAVCFYSANEKDGLRRSRIVRKKGRTLIVHSAEELPRDEKEMARPAVVLADFEGKDYGDWKVEGTAFGDRPATGTLPNQQKVSGFLGEGLVNTYLGGDVSQGTLTSPPFTISRRYINFLIGGGGHEGMTCINLLVDGKIVRTATGKNNERLEWRSWNVRNLEGKKAQIQIVDRHTRGWGHINVDHIELSDRPRGGMAGPMEKLEDYGTMVLAFAGSAASRRKLAKMVGSLRDFQPDISFDEDESYPICERRRTGLLTRNVKLSPGERRTFTFVLSWHFPNHKNGHEYAQRFADAAAVADYVLDNCERLVSHTRLWHDTYYDSTLPHWLLNRLHWPVCNLATNTCQLWKNGRFWAWEGVGCCHGTCTHVWNYEHALARLFPELERTVREMQDLGVAFHPDGLIGFRGERNRAYAADGQAGSILKCYREHQMSGDLSFLRRNWPRIKKALEYLIVRDADGNGMIEDSQHNTYDINFVGPNTFVGSLYLAALRAGEEMAKDVGDEEFAGRVRELFETGSRRSSEILWNGEYFIQLVDLKKHPRFQYGEGCLSDQLFGQGWAHQLGLGYIYPREKVEQALRSVWKYNWAPDVGPYNKLHKPERWFAVAGEPGLFTCTWPKSEYLEQGVRYKNEVWTGIEYQVAGGMIWEGMLTEALAIVRGVHERYHPLKRNPYNEVECGDHYARAMASWGVFLALCGYEHHGPRRHIGFAPRLKPEDFRAAFTAAEGWGSFEQKRAAGKQTDTITVRWGKLRLKSLAFAVAENVASPKVEVRAAGKRIRAQHGVENGRVAITLSDEVVLEEGESLEVTIA